MKVKVLRELGRGGMATVHLARDENLGREVAVKVLHENLLTDDEALARFEREAQVVAKLEHPNILGLYGLTELKGGRLGLVMPYVRGGTLAEWLRRAKGGLELGEVVHVTQEVLRGLVFAHDRGVVHRDIKPGNIFLGEDGERVLIADFGIARATGGRTALTQTGSSLGTPNYMAPEQIDSVSDVDGRADVYAVGMMMWEMLTGERPWSDQTLFNVVFKQKTEDLENPQRRRPDISDTLIQVWRTATRKDRTERWASAQAMLAALEASDLPRQSPAQRDAKPPFAGLNQELDNRRVHASSHVPDHSAASYRIREITRTDPPFLRSHPRSQGVTKQPEATRSKRRTWWTPVHSTMVVAVLLVAGGAYLLSLGSGDQAPSRSGTGVTSVPSAGATAPVVPPPLPPSLPPQTSALTESGGGSSSRGPGEHEASRSQQTSANDELLREDSLMASLYFRLREGLPDADRERLLSDQRSWLRHRSQLCDFPLSIPLEEASGSALDCLLEETRVRRTAELTAWSRLLDGRQDSE